MHGNCSKKYRKKATCTSKKGNTAQPNSHLTHLSFCAVIFIFPNSFPHPLLLPSFPFYNQQNPMSNPDHPSPEKHQLPPPASPEDMESQPPPPAEGFGVSSVLRRWRREDLMKKGSVGLRALALCLSLIAFITMASNKHGDGRNFDDYEEYRYVLAISILSSLYTGWKTIVHFHQFTSSKELIVSRNSAFTDFFGDQVVAYLLISSASSAVPLTDRLREGSDNIFTDSSAAAISMSFLAFFCLGVSAIISGFKLSTQSYT